MEEIIIKFRRIVEGEYRIPANTPRHEAEKELVIELACGTVPVRTIETTFEFMDKGGVWKIAYGYFSITGFDKLLARHCFFLDEEDRVIDPTLFARSDIARNPDYYVMKVFSTYSDYLHAINNENGYPDLCRALRPLEQQVYNWAAEHGFALCG